MACSECTFITPLKHHFQDHINSHDGFRPYPLSLCAYRGTNLVMFKSHLKTLKKYSCADCWYASTEAPQAPMNGENHKGRPILPPKLLKRTRMQRITRVQLMACSECTFITPLKHHFLYHINTHDGFPPYQCSLCDYIGTNLAMLKSHLKTHK